MLHIKLAFMLSGSVISFQGDCHGNVIDQGVNAAQLKACAFYIGHRTVSDGVA